MKEKVDKDTELKAFFETLPELFQWDQKIHTRTPLYTGSRTNPQVIAHLTSTFTRSDQEGDIIGHVKYTIEHINPQPQTDLPTTTPTEVDITLDESPQRTYNKPITPKHSPTP